MHTEEKFLIKLVSSECDNSNMSSHFEENDENANPDNIHPSALEKPLLGTASPKGKLSLAQNLANESALLLRSEHGGGDANFVKKPADDKGFISNENQTDSTIQNEGIAAPTTKEDEPLVKTDSTQPIEIVVDNTDGGVAAPKIKEGEPTAKTDSIKPIEIVVENNDGTDPSKPAEAENANTLTVLDAPNGAKVYLVGTAHFSLNSQEDVSRVIREVRPHIVLVELCQQRTNILLLDEETIMAEAKDINLNKMMSTVRENGMINGLMYILLLNMSAHITKELGMAPGGEFRRAFIEARKIPNCIISLGDRPIDVTIQRALSSLSWYQTGKLIWHLFTSKDPISPAEVEKCKQQQMLDQLLEELSNDYPTLRQVFVNERDIYLSHSLQIAATQVKQNEPCRVVGVVGMGHVAGIVANWGKVDSASIPPLMSIPPPSTSTKVIRSSLKILGVGIVLYVGYRVLPKKWFI